jgi:hypothetical protein
MPISREPINLGDAEAVKKLTQDQRAAHNEAVALRHAKAGLYIVAVDPIAKRPIWGCYQHRDDDNRAAAKQAREDYLARKAAEGKRPAPHLGCTKNPKVIRRAFAADPDVVFGIVGGPNGLVILDLDRHRDGEDGIATLRSIVAEAGVKLPACPMTKTQSGGLHLFFADPLSEFGNHEAGLGAGINVRGAGGQVLLPGTIRPDGKVYRSAARSPDLCAAFALGDIPEMPIFIGDRINAARSGTATKAKDGPVKPDAERPAADRSEQEEYGHDVGREIKERHADDLLPEPNKAVLAEIRKRQPLAFIPYDGALHDASKLRPAVADILRETKRGADAFDYAALVLALPGCGRLKPSASEGDGRGTYSFRTLARDWWHVSTHHDRPAFGSAFGAVTDDEGEEDRPTKGSGKFHFQLFDDAADAVYAESRRHLVKDLVDTGSMAVLYGESNSGKSFFALKMGYCVAAGIPFGERAVEQGLVVYIAAEGGGRINGRLQALKRLHPEHSNVPFALVKSAVDLHDGADWKDIVKLVRSAEEVTGRKAVLIVVDTLARSMGHGSENDAKDMNQVVRNGDKVRTATGAALLYIHHSGKDRAKGARGHSSLRAATDTEIEVVDKGRGERTATVTKQRDLPGDDMISFRLAHVELGKNAEGADLVSAAAQITTDRPAAATEPRKASAAVSKAVTLPPREAEVYDHVKRVAETADADGWVEVSAVLQSINAERKADGDAEAMKDAQCRNLRKSLVGKGLIVSDGAGKVRLAIERSASHSPASGEAFGAVDDDEEGS